MHNNQRKQELGPVVMPNMKSRSSPPTVKLQQEAPAPCEPVALGQVQGISHRTGEMTVYFEPKQRQRGLTVPGRQIFCSWKSADLI